MKKSDILKEFIRVWGDVIEEDRKNSYAVFEELQPKYNETWKEFLNNYGLSNEDKEKFDDIDIMEELKF